ncbi:STM4015 family protein [Streptomyces sedi]|uniref:Leucine-rich repeat domain-containing protein n=1 Tax=Streptomyces sedi TaxID=555059 RepID=A0A5C4V152_9ACTN|nr:STM4015 family protein [Streptomyces sedi]TNM29418.1 leucine-rich repeat domain-containing protein [Streptomyces sedi]
MSGENARLSLAEFHGLPVVDHPRASEGAVERASLPEAGAVAWRVGVVASRETVWEELWGEEFARFLATVDAARVRALVVGTWDSYYDTPSTEFLEAVVVARERLPSLRALFVGDIPEAPGPTWITHGRISELLAAFPALEELAFRSGEELEFAPLRHERLRRLAVESAGLPAAVVRGVGESEFPALTQLELWLGEASCGGDASVEDLAPILSGERLPALRRLGLCNSQIPDEICAALASAPVVAGLEELDLSMGLLTDQGAAALLGGQPLTHLRRLDLTHNYLSEAMRARLREALEPAGVEVRTEAGDAVDWVRFIAVGE